MPVITLHNYKNISFMLTAWKRNDKLNQSISWRGVECDVTCLPHPPSCPSCFLLHQCHITPTHVHCRYRPFIYHVFTAIFKFNHTKTCVRYRQTLLTIIIITLWIQLWYLFYVVGNYVLKLYCVSDNLSIIL